MSSNVFNLNNYIYQLDSSVAGKYYLIGYTTNTTGLPVLTATNVVELVCKNDVNVSVFPSDNFSNCTKLKIQGWTSLSNFTVSNSMLSSLLELQISRTNISALSQSFTALTDLILSNNPLFNIISNGMTSLVRFVIVNCPLLQQFPTNINYTNLTTLHLEGTQITTLATSMSALKFLYLSPKNTRQNFNVANYSNLTNIITRTDVNLIAHNNAHIVLFDATYNINGVA